MLRVEKQLKRQYDSVVKSLGSRNNMTVLESQLYNLGQSHKHSVVRDKSWHTLNKCCNLETKYLGWYKLHTLYFLYDIKMAQSN